MNPAWRASMLKAIREDPDRWRDGCVAKGVEPSLVDKVLSLDGISRTMITEVDMLRHIKKTIDKWTGIQKMAEKMGGRVPEATNLLMLEELTRGYDSLISFYEKRLEVNA